MNSGKQDRALMRRIDNLGELTGWKSTKEKYRFSMFRSFHKNVSFPSVKGVAFIDVIVIDSNVRCQ